MTGPKARCNTNVGSVPWCHKGFFSQSIFFFLIIIAQNLVHRDYSKQIHMHAHTPTHTHENFDYTKLNLHSLKWAATEMDIDSSMEQKTWQVYSLGKINVFRLHLNFWSKYSLMVYNHMH